MANLKDIVAGLAILSAGGLGLTGCEKGDVPTEAPDGAAAPEAPATPETPDAEAPEAPEAPAAEEGGDEAAEGEE